MINEQSLSPTTLVVLRAAIAFVAASFGALFGVAFGRVSHKVLCAFVSFAAGALLSVTALHILPETVEIIGFPLATLTILGGLGLFFFIGKYVYAMCPACAASASEKDHGYVQLGILLMITLAIHSTMDGLAIAAGSEAVPMTGILILFAVSYHKVPEGLALSSVAMLAGYSRLRAFLAAVLIELTTGLGAFLGLVLLKNVSELSLGIVLGIVGGSFIYVVGFALLREMWEHEKSSIIVYTIAGFLSIQAAAMILESYGFGH